MGAAGDGWGLRGRSRSAPGSLRSGCVRGAGKGSARCGVRKKPGEDGGGGVLMGLRLLAFPHLLPLLPPSQRLWAPLRCGVRVRCSRLPALRCRGGDAAVPAPGWGGGVTTHPAPPLPPPLGLCLCPDLTPPRPRGSTHRIPAAPRAFVARWGPRAVTPPPRSPRSAEAGMHAGTCVAWLSATAPPQPPPSSPQWGSDGQRGVCA